MALAAWLVTVCASGQEPIAVTATQSPVSVSNVSIPFENVKWTKMTDGSGRETATLFGDRSKAELFGYLVKWPPNTIAKAHSHPDNRHAMVMSGAFYHGHGSRFDANALQARSKGTYFTEPAGEPHYGATKGEESVLYFVGIGPDRTDAVER
jgi:quercetin dioxygenase-like cupin family protein